MQQDIGKNQTLVMILEILDRVRQSWWTVVAGVCIGVAFGVVALEHLPKVYIASTKILVVPQQIPQDYVRTTVTDDMIIRMAALQQEVLSRPYLERLVDSITEEPLREDERRRMVGSIRSRINVDVTRRANLFVLSFADQDPKRAAQVVNTLAELYIDTNARMRTEQASGTTKTIEEMAKEAFDRLQEKQSEINEYKSNHLHETAEFLAANLQLIEVSQANLEDKEQAITDAEARVESLRELQEQMLAAADDRPLPGVTLDPFVERINTLRSELEALRTRYYDEHPDVKAKQREIDDLIAQRRPRPETEEAGSGQPIGLPLSADIAEAEAELQRLMRERERIQQNIQLYQARIENTPRVEATLAELSRGVDALSHRHASLQVKVEQAKGAETIEQARKGQQFSVIEAAVPPSGPVKPVKLHVLGASVALGLLIFVSPIPLGAILAPRVESEASLARLAPVPVLVNLPRINTPAAEQERKRRRLLNVALALCAVAVMAGTISFIEVLA